MRKNVKKLVSVIAAAAMSASVLALSSCGDSYNQTALPGDVSGTVVSNGGFVVEKGNYVYFINGTESYSANNTYGEVTKGALMRISKTNLAAGNYSASETVVPLVISTENKQAGFYIYGDYIYFATPTSDKYLDGVVANTHIDFKRAKLDGSETMKDNFFRLSDNSVQFRYVEVGGVVYCMYVENGVLKSYNTATNTTSVLASGADEYYFNLSDKTDANVYYTMNVKHRLDGDDTLYNQIYTVNATATATVNADAVSYTVNGGRTYAFDKEYCEENVKGFNASDYATYPYVNLGTLVLDGIGADKTINLTTQYNNGADVQSATAATPNGYSYSLERYTNSGIYFTRVEAGVASPETPFYYLPTSATAATWNTVSGNTTAFKITANYNQGSAYFLAPNAGVHQYLYVDTNDKNLYRGETDASGNELTPVCISESVDTAEISFVQGSYAYFYGSGSVGSDLSRVNYTGTKENYHPWRADEFPEYQTEKILKLEWNTSWFVPELVGNYLFYANTVNTANNYVYVVPLKGSNADGSITTAELKAFNEKYTDIQEYLTEAAEEDGMVENALRYYFATGKLDVYENLKAQFTEDQVKLVNAFVAYDGEHKDYKFEKYFTAPIGAMSASDQEILNKTWSELIYVVDSTETPGTGFPVWAIVLISVGGGLLVAAGVAVPIIIHAKKKKKAAENYEKTRVKKYIDTTDDKSINVYEDEAETAEEPVKEQETVVAAEETVAPVKENAEEVAQEESAE